MKSHSLMVLGCLVLSVAAAGAKERKRKDLPEEFCWEKLKSINSPSPRFDQALVSDQTGKRIFMFGGRDGVKFLDDLLLFDTEKSEWHQLASDQKPEPRSGASLVYDEESKRLFLFGGFHTDVYGKTLFLNDLWVYGEADGWTREFFASGPSPRAWHAAAKSGSSLLVSGGFGGPTGDHYLNDVWVYDLAEKTFLRAAADGGPKMAGRPQLLDVDSKRMLLFFGKDSAPAATRVGLWVLDREASRWTTLRPDGSPAVSYSVSAANPWERTVLAIQLREPSEHESLIWLYDVDTGRWQESQGEKGPSQRNGMVCTAHPVRAGSWLCFGGVVKDKVLPELWLLRPSQGSGCES
jgi:hypothetical protein